MYLRGLCLCVQVCYARKLLRVNMFSTRVIM